MTVQESHGTEWPVVCVLGRVAVYESTAYPDKLWLRHSDGEGGCFDRAEVLAVIERGPVALERYFWERF